MSGAEIPFPAGKVKIGKSVAVTCEECEVVIHWEWFLTPEEAKERRAKHIADHRSGKIVAAPGGGNTLRGPNADPPGDVPEGSG
jgi:hypothetical protein